MPSSTAVGTRLQFQNFVKTLKGKLNPSTGRGYTPAERAVLWRRHQQESGVVHRIPRTRRAPAVATRKPRRRTRTGKGPSLATQRANVARLRIVQAIRKQLGPGASLADAWAQYRATYVA